jgi:DNA-3-methyladenine glycosylase
VANDTHEVRELDGTADGVEGRRKKGDAEGRGTDNVQSDQKDRIRKDSMPPLSTRFYARDPITVAPDLLGRCLVRDYHGLRLSGVITETEAYPGRGDTASHASKGLTARTRPLFGPPGRAYVYLIYGIHNMLNVVVGEPEAGGCVLIRALEPLEGRVVMQQFRGREAPLADGPGKLCEALDIDRTLDSHDLTKGRHLWIEPGRNVDADRILNTPRIGIDYADPRDRREQWRFVMTS